MEVRHMPAADAAILDAYLILKNKERRFADVPERLGPVQSELRGLQQDADELLSQFPALAPLAARLTELHSILYDVEDEKRAIERGESVEELTERLLRPESAEELREYLRLAREVSLRNDERASIKRAMNEITGSSIAEVKGYPAAGL